MWKKSPKSTMLSWWAAASPYLLLGRPDKQVADRDVCRRGDQVPDDGGAAPRRQALVGSAGLRRVHAPDLRGEELRLHRGRLQQGHAYPAARDLLAHGLGVRVHPVLGRVVDRRVLADGPPGQRADVHQVSDLAWSVLRGPYQMR